MSGRATARVARVLGLAALALLAACSRSAPPPDDFGPGVPGVPPSDQLAPGRPSRPPAPPAPPAWTGAPLPVTTIATTALTPVPSLPVDATLARRIAGGWLVVATTSPYPHERSSLTYLPDSEAPRVLAEADSGPRLWPYEGGVLVDYSDLDAQPLGAARLVVADDGPRLESLGRPRLSRVARGAAELLASCERGDDWRSDVLAVSPDDRSLLWEGGYDDRVVGLDVLGDDLVLAVSLRDASGSASVGTRASAIMQGMNGDWRAASALAGPPRGALVTLVGAAHATASNATKPPVARSEVFPDQRPNALAVLDGGWLVVVTEGTLRRGLNDAVVVARAPGEASGWRLLAEPLSSPGFVVARGAWVALSEATGNGGIVHAIAPALGRHLATPELPGIVALWDIDASPGHAPRLVFLHAPLGGKPDRVLALDLE